MRSPRSPDSGQALPLLTLVLLVAVAALFVVVETTVGATWRAQASAAADAAALAGAAEGESSARRLAEANGAELVSFERIGGERVQVVVRRHEATARATAERTSGAGELAPVMAAAVARAEQLLGRPLPFTTTEPGLTIDVDPAILSALADVAPHAGLCRSSPEDHPVHFAPCPSTSRRTTPRSALASVVPVATVVRGTPAARHPSHLRRAARPT